MSYFILGLPRSRTTWIANFLTYDGNYCHHEAINGCSSVDEYKEKIDGCGDSTTNILMFDYEKDFPDSKIIIIHRDIKESIEFSKKVFKSDMTEMIEKANERLNLINGLHIMFDEINDKLKDIWEYLFDSEFSPKRAAMLSGFNIQPNDVFDVDKQALTKLNKEVSIWHG